jgi:hypothetical protein
LLVDALAVEYLILQVHRMNSFGAEPQSSVRVCDLVVWREPLGAVADLVELLLKEAQMVGFALAGLLAPKLTSSWQVPLLVREKMDLAVWRERSVTLAGLPVWLLLKTEMAGFVLAGLPAREL